MQKGIQRLMVFICALVMMCTGPVMEGAFAEMNQLPWDFSGGMPLDKEGFKGSGMYGDSTIQVQILKGTYPRGAELPCDYWVAMIRISHPSQLRTAAANGFNSTQVIRGRVLAKRVNAVVAINGDYFWYTNHGYIVRQGQEFLNDLRGDRDVLLIGEAGAFHTVYNAYSGDVGSTVNGKKVMQALYFGPVLLENGKMIRNMDLRYDMRAEERRQRMCLAQIGPLQYMCVCCAGPARNNSGMNLTEFARLVYEIGKQSNLNIQVAYNMDGGDSTMLIFNGERINDPTDTRDREIADIVYFASAQGAK